MKWPEFVELAHTLRIKAGHQVALINAPPHYAHVIPGVEGCDPHKADAVIGFVVRSKDLGLRGCVYQAALSGRVAWISYPKPGRLGSDLHRDCVARDVRRYGLQSVRKGVDRRHLVCAAAATDRDRRVGRVAGRHRPRFAKHMSRNAATTR